MEIKHQFNYFQSCNLKGTLCTHSSTQVSANAFLSFFTHKQIMSLSMFFFFNSRLTFNCTLITIHRTTIYDQVYNVIYNNYTHTSNNTI